MRVVLFSTYVAWAIANLISTDPSCTISINYQSGNLKEPQPLLLNQNMTIWYPEDHGGRIRIPVNGSIYLACPGDNNYLTNENWGDKVEAVCVRDDVFDVNEITGIRFSSLVCKSHTWHRAKRMDSLPCLERHSPIEIGFSVSGSFIPTIELCRDDETKVTYYTKFKMTKMIKYYQINYPRPSKFLAGSFYPDIDIDQLYKFKTQLNTLAEILNSTELAKQRLKKSEQFLSRGHLAAKADFVYGAQQRSTFWYLNTAPQWKSFNEGNWYYLEVIVRIFATTKNLDLDVYTGVHGQMTMLDIHNEQQPVYLGVDGAISVPKFYWKVIYDPLSRRGIAFIGLNDPFIDSVTSDVYLCTDVSERVAWLWIIEKNDIKAGILYACDVTDLRRAVPTVPELDVINILT
ncbi:uncharacterized protein [Linepithema humile]|uniref:uncharacterized protein n=1 Tax=Linepithema humile TaxID=83485 RepID=UPI0006230F97|nr:PREDICTED: uncharacterized protein LOC105677008 [Linepithema humile]